MSKTNVTFFDRFLNKHPDTLSVCTYNVTIMRTMTIAEYLWGWVIETMDLDDEFTTTLETLTLQRTSKTAVLLNRERYGSEYNDFRSYPRDSVFPVGCFVRLAKESSTC